MAEFLLELLSEEIPARMQSRAKEDLALSVCKALDAAGLVHGEAASFATPRRLVLVIDDLAARQPDVDVERKGPRVGAPEKALEGFKKSLGVEHYDLSEQPDKKGAVYVARFRRVGRPTSELLREILPTVLEKFPWPKSMRWSSHKIRWVRPLHGILCLFDGKVVPFVFGPVASGNTSRGHRFHAPEAFEVTDIAGYRRELARRFVMLDRDRRRDRIKGRAETIAGNEKLRLRRDDSLLDEVAGLVEWPVALCGGIDATFMDLPDEVLVTAMRAHQKYLALEDENGNLAPRFVAIANLEAGDGGQAIVAGNERVLRARLWDAKFFWDQDRRRPLDELVPKLDDIVFHARLGSLGDKTRRLERLAGWLTERISEATTVDVCRAARLAKADLVTGMVGEFPELQGVMGRYYALCHGDNDAVAAAIGDHYAPQGPSDACPTAPVTIAVALADKLDTLSGFFLIGEKPTGSKDPYALRRAALGVIRLILENRIRLSLGQAFSTARAGYDDLVRTGPDEEAVHHDPVTFVFDRLKVHLRESGVRHDLLSAVFATGDDDLVGVLARVEALEGFLATDDGANLLAAYRRAGNIVRIETKKDGREPLPDVDPALLHQPEERALYQGMETARASITSAISQERYADAMAALAALRKVIDEFFERVMVNDDDPGLRQNRLKLLKTFHTALFKVADFSLIEDVTTENHNRRVA